MVENFAWIFFRMPTLNDSLEFIKRIIFMSNGNFIKNSTDFVFIILAACIVLFKEICEEMGVKHLPLAQSRYVIIRFSTYIVLIFLILLCGVLDSSNFIYVNF